MDRNEHEQATPTSVPSELILWCFLHSREKVGQVSDWRSDANDRVNDDDG